MYRRRLPHSGEQHHWEPSGGTIVSRHGATQCPPKRSITGINQSSGHSGRRQPTDRISLASRFSARVNPPPHAKVPFQECPPLVSLKYSMSGYPSFACLCAGTIRSTVATAASSARSLYRLRPKRLIYAHSRFPFASCPDWLLTNGGRALSRIHRPCAFPSIRAMTSKTRSGVTHAGRTAAALS